jgi:hypothetical protein
MARHLVCTPSSVAFIVRSRAIVFLVWAVCFFSLAAYGRPPHAPLQLCICLLVLGVFFAINAQVGISDSSYTISVVASVIVFVIFILMACFCAPLTFSTEFVADAKRKVIRFDAAFLGCISWRSMCNTCKFQDVQVQTCVRTIQLLPPHHALSRK